MKLPASLYAVLICLPLMACSRQPDDASQTSTVASLLDDTVSKSIRKVGDKVQQKMAAGDISIGGDTLPKAAITATGELVIDGTPVALDAAQRQQLMAYRQQLVDIANDGVGIGLQGAELGVGAAAEALGAVFNGEDEKQMNARIEARADDIRQAARQLCERLPALMSAQQQLASAVPAFAPYASMDQDAVDTCRREGSVSLP